LLLKLSINCEKNYYTIKKIAALSRFELLMLAPKARMLPLHHRAKSYKFGEGIAM
jgi:hypothetical protein